eukprot:TRINITY_DN61186_c0_g1_i1.p1 TRINITY_DN61186_c0_g1~~TRINITY_DN61186_c0_g1_i1.p1  ORF type:complete len:338 (-),score=57.84 TRINITY_DN61186_c0_g1_i1:291-1304(-)
MCAAGRVWRNPSAPNEIWVNFGYHLEGYQIIPGWQEWMSEHIPESEYRMVVEAVERQLQDGGNPGFCLGVLGIYCCLCTLGVSGACLECSERGWLQRMERAVSEITMASGNRCSVQLVKEMDHFSKQWVDSEGKDLHYRYPTEEYQQHWLHIVMHGPPPGFNVVFTLPGSVEWPPKSAASASHPVHSIQIPHVLSASREDGMCSLCNSLLDDDDIGLRGLCAGCASPLPASAKAQQALAAAQARSEVASAKVSGDPEAAAKAEQAAELAAEEEGAASPTECTFFFRPRASPEEIDRPGQLTETTNSLRADAPGDASHSNLSPKITPQVTPNTSSAQL